MTRSIVESGYFPAEVVQSRIVNVNVNDWTIDAVGLYANQRFFDIQVASPYMHHFGGEGIYAMPEVGAICWVCQASTGLRAQRFVMGFGAVADERVDQSTGKQSGNFRANRQNLNPGDIMMRTRDSNFVILRRGGVVQIGAGPATQRLYIPIKGIIKDFCQGYNLFSLAGEMDWEVDRVEQSDAGQVSTRFVLKAKTHADEPDHAVILTLGSQKDDPDIRLSLVVNESGATGAPSVVQLTVDKTGTVNWAVQNDMLMSVRNKVSFTAQEGDLVLEALKTNLKFSAAKDWLATIGGNLSFKAAGEALVQATKAATIKAPAISLAGKTDVGGSEAKDPLVLGLALVDFLTAMINGLTNPGAAFGVAPPPGNPMLFPGMAALAGQLSQLLSKNNKTS